MDSFYDQPRNAPKPTSINKLTGPLIPEVSIIQSPVTNVRQGVRHQPLNVESYNVWKARNQMDAQQGNKENFSPHYVNRQLSDPTARKQVRFESPTLHRSNSNPCQNPVFAKDGQNRNFDTRPFEEIYMANIPNRNLDLSVLELPVNKNNGIVNNQNNGVVSNINYGDIHSNKIDTNNGFSNKVNEDCDLNCYDIYNYKRGTGNILPTRENQKELEKSEELNQMKTYAEFKRQINIDENKTRNNDFLSKDHLYSRNLCDTLTNNDYQPERHQHFCYDNFSRNDDAKYNLQISTKKPNDDEPTTRDLLKVIQQQNEQILLLQKQVACLLEAKANQKQIENVNYDPPSRADYSPNAGNDHEKYKKVKKGPLSKIAIDVMTSFEVSFRPQNQNVQRNRLKELDDSPKIEEIRDDTNSVSNVLDGIKKNDKFDANDEVSLSFQEPLKVMERCPSPEQSIHVEMQDYSSTDEEDVDSDIGWTVYNNIMGQVNNIFKNTQTDAQQNHNDKVQVHTDTIKNKTLKRVKEATMKHLKSIGVNLPLMDDHHISKDDSKSSDEFNSSDVSFAVKQLLMKYLPDEQLAKLTRNEAKRAESNENFIRRRPEFSFATIQYMKKYNLLPSDAPNTQQPTRPQITNSQKILDVTALKQQPKLL